ncbi:MAG: 50S ribosomal protein L23 [Leptospiraceae bacterium]|nr:50S ribosomal protein L23 [Leptospiraceae bacterium]
MNFDKIIIAPIVTEKSQALEEIGKSQGKRTVKYCFKVHPDANKIMIAASIKKIFSIEPTSINTQIYKGKIKRFRNSKSQRPHWKKAIVTFADGAKLEFGKGV